MNNSLRSAIHCSSMESPRLPKTHSEPFLESEDAAFVPKETKPKGGPSGKGAPLRKGKGAPNAKSGEARKTKGPTPPKGKPSSKKNRARAALAKSSKGGNAPPKRRKP